MARITLKELAELAHTSIRSVNRALKGESGVGEDRRAAILKLASELGYVPNVAARNLRLRRSNFVGVLSSNYGNNIHLRKLYGLVRKLEEHAYFPLLSVAPGDVESVSRMFREWSGFVNYVVVLGGLRPQVLEEFEKMPQHFILVDNEMDTANCSRLLIDRSTGIKDGILHLARNGRSRLARCGNIPSREAGLRKAFEELPEGRKLDFVYFKSKADFEDGWAIGPELMASGADAVFFDTDRMALGFLKYAWKNRIRIPEDISVIGFDDDPMDTQACPALSTVAHPIDEINDKIIELIEQRAENGGDFVFATKFINREST
ncbi:MAG: LacI family DNA-binding transcriptional regulator [Victivallaceae bacterium]|nr:LacI family DNA-binding transcriptional regulator [Victivallaceae bacterium]